MNKMTRDQFWKKHHGLTNEQIEHRWRIYCENHFLMEQLMARQSGNASSNVGFFGGSGQALSTAVFDQVLIIAYRQDSESDSYEVFTYNYETGVKSAVTEIPYVSDVELFIYPTLNSGFLIRHSSEFYVYNFAGAQVGTFTAPTGEVYVGYDVIGVFEADLNSSPASQNIYLIKDEQLIVFETEILGEESFFSCADFVGTKTQQEVRIYGKSGTAVSVEGDFTDYYANDNCDVMACVTGDTATIIGETGMVSTTQKEGFTLSFWGFISAKGSMVLRVLDGQNQVVSWLIYDGSTNEWLEIEGDGNASSTYVDGGKSQTGDGAFIIHKENDSFTAFFEGRPLRTYDLSLSYSDTLINHVSQNQAFVMYRNESSSDNVAIFKTDGNMIISSFGTGLDNNSWYNDEEVAAGKFMTYWSQTGLYSMSLADGSVQQFGASNVQLNDKDNAGKSIIVSQGASVFVSVGDSANFSAVSLPEGFNDGEGFDSTTRPFLSGKGERRDSFMVAYREFMKGFVVVSGTNVHVWNMNVEQDLLSMDVAMTPTYVVIDGQYSNNGLFPFSDQGEANEINDGGDDMFDGANAFYTNYPAGIVPYTHTQSAYTYDQIIEMSIPLVDAFPMDGEMRDGTDYFGGGQYFTNHYIGMFALSAYGTDVSHFGVSGNLGADGSGVEHFVSFEITAADTVFGCHAFGVHTSGDPSVYYIIMADQTVDVTSLNMGDLNDMDFRVLFGGSNATELHAILVSKNGSVAFTSGELQNLAQNYLNITARNQAGALAELNENYASVYAELGIGETVPFTRVYTHSGTLVWSSDEYRVATAVGDAIRLTGGGYLDPHRAFSERIANTAGYEYSYNHPAWYND